MNPLRWAALSAVACVLASTLVGTGDVLAATPHEDPDTATPVFSGIALFQFYSSSIDPILLKNADQAQATLTMMPWANVPDNLKTVTADFEASGISLALIMTQIDSDLSLLRTYIDQSRLDDAGQAAARVSPNLAAALSQVDRLDRALVQSGAAFDVTAAPPDSDLAVSYRQAEDAIVRLRQTLDLSSRVLSADNQVIDRLRSLELGPTAPLAITLDIDSETAFVGDTVIFQGTLSSGSALLGNRDIEILLNQSALLTVRTDDSGHYRGVFSVPYRYQPQLSIQSLYVPQGFDSGFYVAALSKAVQLKVLYYTAQLEVQPGGKAYPGRDMSLAVSFDYGSAPFPGPRDLEVYLDNRLIEETSAPSAVADLMVPLDPSTSTGRHALTVSSKGIGRYAPSLAVASVEVTRAEPFLGISLPRIIFIPSSLSLEGNDRFRTGTAGSSRGRHSPRF